MKVWVVKTKNGYGLWNYEGKYLRFFTMPCDCKCYCESKNYTAIIISDKTVPNVIKQYESATGRRYYGIK